MSRKNYFLFKWRSVGESSFGQSIVSNELLLMRTALYDVSIHFRDCTCREYGLDLQGEEIIDMRNRETRDKWGFVKRHYGCDRLIDNLIKSKNRDRDLWKLELETHPDTLYD